MEKLKNNLPLIILIVLELAVGVLLLINAELFTRVILILFGVGLMGIGVLFLVRSITNADNGAMSWLALALSVVAFVVGVLCTFFSGSLINVVAIIAVIYGVIMVISAIFKIKAYLDVRRMGLKPSPFTLLSAVIAFILGVVIILNPFKAVEALFIFTGIVLIVQAVLDIAMLVFKIKLEN
ncbi:MAG: DUF308 domain-containing protein [Clostridia bacterium]|nr:DUF308 domain-containing protein [Clostridia bacterium]